MQVADSNLITRNASHMEAMKEYLAFKLGAEEYGIDIQQVQEIRGYEAPTAIANAPAFIKGLANLRGAIVPIIDLRIKFGFEPTYDQFTCIIVLNIANRTIGLVVDSVTDVTALAQEQIQPAPQMGALALNNGLSGMGMLEGRMLILLDAYKLLSSGDIGILEEIAA